MWNSDGATVFVYVLSFTSSLTMSFVLRFLSASSAGNNTKRFPPVSVPAVEQEPPKQRLFIPLGGCFLLDCFEFPVKIADT